MAALERRVAFAEARADAAEQAAKLAIVAAERTHTALAWVFRFLAASGAALTWWAAYHYVG